jgi:NAD(P)-dependent dehydrogenase (short-subunit alcohol dehydrogenase family)
VTTAVADVREPEAVEAALAAAEEALGPAHTVVCGAAGNFVAPAEQLSSKGFRTVVEIDLMGAFHAAQAGFAQLRRTRGSVLFVSAGQSRQPYVYQSHVGAAKAGIDSLMRTLALEWARHGVRANSIVPGPIRGTEGMERLSAAASAETWNAMVPLGRFGEVAEVGAMAVVLSSPLAAFVTGTEVIVDGGLALCGSGMFNQVVEQAAAAAKDADRGSDGDESGT